MKKTENFEIIKKNLDYKDRANILGEDLIRETGKIEESDEIKGKKKDFLSEESKKRITNIKKFVKGSEQDMIMHKNLENLFCGDSKKQERFKNFSLEKDGKIVGGLSDFSYRNYAEKEREMKEFEKLYEELLHNIKEPEIGDRITELKKIIDVEKRKRITEQWMPDKMLCKRFGVKQPYEGKVIYILFLN